MKSRFDVWARLCLLLCLVGSAGCAIGPLVFNETARPLGPGNKEIVAGYGHAGHVIKFSYGLDSDLDLGFQFEALSVGVRLKKAFVNNEIGWSFAGALGLGNSIGGSHYYGDFIASRLWDSWEPYGTIRIVHVNSDSTTYTTSDGSDFFTTTAFSWNYGTVIVGSRYWFSSKWLMVIEAATLFALEGETSAAAGALLGMSIGYRF